MAIMPVAITKRPVGGADPFRTRVAVPGVLTHGHLPEHANHGGGAGPYANPAALPDGPRAAEVDVGGFLYRQGDLPLSDARRLPPVNAPGPVALTAASNRLSRQTPANLAPGTYAYFCRIQPFMRGAFRVVGA